MSVEYVRFDVPGAPVAKARPRAARCGPGGAVRVYTPSKSVRFEERVRLCAMEAGVTPLHGPVALMVTFVFPMKGAPRKTKPRRAAWKPTRPDLSNLVKSVEDGLNSVGYADDAQVVCIIANKTHAAQGESPHTEVILQRLAEYAPEGGE